MTSLGIQMWVLSSNGLRIAFWHSGVMELLEGLRVLGHSYRLASIGVGSSTGYGRLTLDFCQAIAAEAVCNLVSRRSVERAASSVRIRNVMAKDARRSCG